MKKEIAFEILVASLILLFTYTGVNKLLDYDKFVVQMRLSPLTMIRSNASVLGLIVPLTELCIVGGLLTARFKTIALCFSIALLTIFEIYILYMMLSGLQLPCSCGGVIGKMNWKQHLIFNAFFIGIGIQAFRLNKKIKKQFAHESISGNLKYSRV